MAGAIVRLLTCGSVDDGKSTLIGRLLVETDSIPHDTIGAARKVRRSGSTIPAGEIDFSLKLSVNKESPSMLHIVQCHSLMESA